MTEKWKSESWAQDMWWSGKVTRRIDPIFTMCPDEVGEGGRWEGREVQDPKSGIRAPLRFGVIWPSSA